MKKLLLTAFSVIVMASAFGQGGTTPQTDPQNPQTTPRTNPQSDPQTTPRTNPQSDTTAYPQNEPYTSPREHDRYHMDDKDKEEVKSSELPQAVTRALEGNDYRGWRVEDKAYKIKGDDNKEYYKVSLRNASTGETKTVKLDEDGNKKDDDKDWK
jgi:hypothetical protein